MRKILLLALLALAVLLPLAGCSDGGSSSSAPNVTATDGSVPQPTSPAAEPVAITADYVIHMAELLPPDPGENADDTVEGVDVNHNGVRDDIERWIALEAAPQSAKVRALLLQDALAHERVIRGAYSREEADSIEHDLSRAAAAEAPHYDVYLDEIRRLEALYFDSEDRMQRSRDFDRWLAGGVYPVLVDEPKEELFDIDPDLLPN